MSTHDQSNGEDQRRAARLTAYALGQLDATERAEVEAELAASPQARETVRLEQALAAQLRQAAQHGQTPERSAALRDAVERRLQELEAVVAPLPIAKARRGRPLRLVLAVAATLLIAAVPTYFYLANRGAVRSARNVAMSQKHFSEMMKAAGGEESARKPMPPGNAPSLGPTNINETPEEPTVFGDSLPVTEPPVSIQDDAEYNHDSEQIEHKGGGMPTNSKDVGGLGGFSAPAFGPGPKAVGHAGVGTGVGAGTIPGSAFGGRGSGHRKALSAQTAGQEEAGFTRDGDQTGGDKQSGDGKMSQNAEAASSLFSATPQSTGDGRQQGGGETGLGPAPKRIVMNGLSLGTRLNRQPQSEGDDKSSPEDGPDNVVHGIQRALAPGNEPGDRSGHIHQEKPVETWKPSRLVPNTSRLMVGDHEELPLRGMQVDVRVDGFRARVVLDLYYLNNQPRQLEGNFQLRLPEEATPYFFAFGRTMYQARQIEPAEAMFFKREQVAGADTTPEQILALRRGSWEEPKVARMVTREKAAYAYRETVRRRIDPALVEWAGAGVFQCRVFPLAPQSLHRVVIGYDVDLVRAGDDLELRLDLPERNPACVVDLNIAAPSAKQVSLDASATASADGQRLSYRLVDPQERPLTVRLHEPGTTMLVGGDGKTGDYFAVRTMVPLADRKGKQALLPQSPGSKEAIFLVDTSLSAGPQFPLWTKLLRAVLENNRGQIDRFAVLFFNVETFWWQEKYVANTPENVDALMHYADGLALEGATDLGRALGEAAAPRWRKSEISNLKSQISNLKSQISDLKSEISNVKSEISDVKSRPELFLLSDGAGTWGEDRWQFMTAALKSAKSGPLFAYHTGLGGSDPRLLAHLAQATGGAVFSVVGEAEIARASIAQRQRPWRLANVEVSGGQDILLAGRPEFVFPGQQLLVVGRCKPGLESGEVTLTLQQGDVEQTVHTKIDRVLTSEIAARTYGQVAVGQLEDAAATSETTTAESVEPIATGYARHFRITGRTCSLLMLESEQDYARFNIKPEEDDFLVSDRPAAAIVAKAMGKNEAAQLDPKTSFLAWFRGLTQNSGVHFDLPASLPIALEGLPRESFAVAVPPLRCKLHMRQELPENMQQLWAAGVPDYEAVTEESERRLTRYGTADALRALSSLVEEHPGDAAVARDVAFSAMAWDLPGEAYHLLRRAAAGRNFEPLGFHALAHCLEQMGHADLAIVYYELACGGQWDPRFGDMHNIAQFDYFRFLRRVAAGQSGGTLGNYAQARLATLAAAQVRDTADVVALMFWNTDGTDVDLHVTEPSGEDCYYAHRETANGGHISQDVTTGLGPEMYILPQAPAGTYDVRAHYFALDANRASTRTKVFALIYQGWGTKAEKLTRKAVTLAGQSEAHELAKITIGQ